MGSEGTPPANKYKISNSELQSHSCSLCTTNWGNFHYNVNAEMPDINNNDTIDAVKGSMPQYVLIENFISCTQASKKMLTFAQALSMNILLHITHRKTKLPCPLT